MNKIEIVKELTGNIISKAMVTPNYKFELRQYEALAILHWIIKNFPEVKTPWISIEIGRSNPLMGPISSNERNAPIMSDDDNVSYGIEFYDEGLKLSTTYIYGYGGHSHVICLILDSSNSDNKEIDLEKIGEWYEGCMDHLDQEDVKFDIEYWPKKESY